MSTRRTKNQQTANERFLLACENGDIKLAMQQIEEGADVHYHNASGESPMHLAVKSGSVDMVIYMTNTLRLHPDQRDSYGRTPLHWAAQQGNVPIVEALLLAHASVQAKDDLGVEPKTYAELSNNRDLIKIFSLVRNSRKT